MIDIISALNAELMEIIDRIETEKVTRGCFMIEIGRASCRERV